MKCEISEIRVKWEWNMFNIKLKVEWNGIKKNKMKLNLELWFYNSV